MIVTKAEAKELYNKLKKTENLGQTWRRSNTDWVIELRDEDNPTMLARSVYCSPSYGVPGHAVIQSWVFLPTGTDDHATMREDQMNSERAALLLVNDAEGYALCAHTGERTNDLRFSAGCRNFRLEEALSHWTFERQRTDYLEAIFEYIGCMGTRKEREVAKEWPKRFGNMGSDMKEAYKRGVALRKEGLTC